MQCFGQAGDPVITVPLYQFQWVLRADPHKVTYVNLLPGTYNSANAFFFFFPHSGLHFLISLA